MKQFTKCLAAWSCVAHCEDQSKRLVTGFFQDDRCVLISRSWVTPLHKTILHIQHPISCPALEAIISSADFQVVDGAWIGATRINGHALACATGASANSGYTRLADLARAGFIQYEPGTGPITHTAIRIFPANHLTGVPLVQPSSEWNLSFIAKLDRVMKLHEMAAPRMEWSALP